jgi:hypothetical protein
MQNSTIKHYFHAINKTTQLRVGKPKETNHVRLSEKQPVPDTVLLLQHYHKQQLYTILKYLVKFPFRNKNIHVRNWYVLNKYRWRGWSTPREDRESLGAVVVGASVCWGAKLIWSQHDPPKRRIITAKHLVRLNCQRNWVCDYSAEEKRTWSHYQLPCTKWRQRTKQVVISRSICSRRHVETFRPVLGHYHGIHSACNTWSLCLITIPRHN